VIAKHTLGKGFRGLLSYLLREGMAGRAGEGIVLGGNMSGRNARELAGEFGVFRRLNPAVGRPVFHASLRLPMGETLTDAQWRDAARLYLARLGYTDTAYVVVRHPEHHIHIVASRVRFDSSTVRTWQDRWRSLEAVADLEYQFGLSQPRVRPVPLRTSAPERARDERRGEPLPRQLLATRLEQAIARSDGTREGFTLALAALGVEARWNIARTGRIHGASFRLLAYDGPLQAAMKGSAIGPAFAWGQLAVRLAVREHEYLAALGTAYPIDAQRQRVSSTQAPPQQAPPQRANSRQDGGALPGGERGGPVTHQPPVAPPVAAVSARLVQDARTTLAQQQRWNGHLAEAAVLRLAVFKLSRAYPAAGVPTILAAIQAAQPGSLTSFPGGKAALAAELEAAQATRTHEQTNAPRTERDYGTR
jgi:hypothetical protein